MSSSVDQIKSKLDIVSVISSYIPLEKAGGNFKGKCPFHNEKTPSFFVSPDRGSYYCFGCHASGDIFTFVQEFEGIDFVGALKMLAERAGVTLEHFDKQQSSEVDRLYQVLEQAVFYYQKQFTATPEAETYVQGRGLTAETIRNFRIGFAPAEWRGLFDFLKTKGMSEADMLAAGLIKRKENSDSYYDVFRGRIMFPISDSSGRVVGFSGRILIADDKSPKYLNSPETEVFKKSETLFGLDKAKKDIRIRGYSILVEGQMDLVMLHQAGFTNTVASSGTALSTEHLVKLRRLSSRIIVAYDGDNAGFAAAERTATLALSLGMELKVAPMPEGKDPADLALSDPKDLAHRIQHATHIIDFYVDSLIARGLTNQDLGAGIRTHVLSYVRVIGSAIEQAQFMRSIARKTYMKEEALWKDLQTIDAPPVVYREDSTVRPDRVASIEKKVLGVLMWQQSRQSPDIDLVVIEQRARDILKDRFDMLYLHLEKEKEALLFEMEAYYNTDEHAARRMTHEIDELIRGLEEEYLKKDLTTAMMELQKAEREKNTAAVTEYLLACQRISQRINALRNPLPN